MSEEKDYLKEMGIKVETHQVILSEKTELINVKSETVTGPDGSPAFAYRLYTYKWEDGRLSNELQVEHYNLSVANVERKRI